MHHRQSVWPVIAASFLVALAAAWSIYGLQRWAGRSAEIQLQLVDLRGALNALDGLEWRAISRKQLDPDLLDDVRRVQQRVATLVARVAKVNQQPHLIELHRRYIGAIGSEFAMIEAGELDQALAYDEAQVDPAFEDLAAEIASAAAVRGAAAQRVSRYATLGMAASLLVAALMIGWLFARFTRAREVQAVELKRALGDLRQTQEQLVQSGKLAALGQLVASIAHEINTPLGAIRAAAGNAVNALQASLHALPALGQRLDVAQQAGFFAMLEQALAGGAEGTSERRALRRALALQLDAAGIDDSRRLADVLVDIGVRERIDEALPILRHPDREWLLALAYDLTRLRGNSEIILEAVERASKVVFALKSYAHVEHGEQMQPVDVRDSIETVLELYGSQIRQGIEVQREFDDMGGVVGHADELVQVWTNLIHNAMQAMDGRGLLRLASTRGDGCIVVSITDSGPGVPAALQARIFEPFFSTKPRGEGTGLGLHICREIVAKHGGEIQLASVPGRTTFTVMLPTVAAPAATTGAAA